MHVPYVHAVTHRTYTVLSTRTAHYTLQYRTHTYAHLLSWQSVSYPWCHLPWHFISISSHFQEYYLIAFCASDQNKTKFVFLTYVQLRILHVTTISAGIPYKICPPHIRYLRLHFYFKVIMKQLLLSIRSSWPCQMLTKYRTRACCQKTNHDRTG